MKFYPYKYEYTASALGGLSTMGFPTYSIIDPETTAPLTGNLPNAFFSYGNCHVTKAYDVHTRSMPNYTDLGLSKQPTLILQTNGSAASRQIYVEPASIHVL